jgi:hypothetical protein
MSAQIGQEAQLQRRDGLARLDGASALRVELAAAPHHRY